MLARSSVSQIRSPPRPSTRLRNSLMVHSLGGVQDPKACRRLSLLFRLSFALLPDRVDHCTMNFIFAPVVRAHSSGAPGACRTVQELSTAADEGHARPNPS